MPRAVIFDWGNTLMRDFPEYSGPMAGWPRVELIAGVAEALDALPGGLIRCVASNAGASNVELMGRALERAGIRWHFQHLFTSTELGAAKPAPRFFTEVARRIGVPPGACIMVGDNYRNDICGARAAGMLTVWLRTDEAVGPGEPTAAHRVIGAMADLPRVIRELVGRGG